jgi:hypothetical protein
MLGRMPATMARTQHRLTSRVSLLDCDRRKSA